MIYGKRYLKNVVIVLENGKDAELFHEILNALAQQDINAALMDVQGNYLDGKRLEGGRGDEVLWITDSDKTAEYLFQKSYYVLGYLHREDPAFLAEDSEIKDEKPSRTENTSCRIAGYRYLFEDPEELTIKYLERVYRRFQKIPWDILETKRCFLRETTEADVDAFYEIYKDPDITRYMENLYADPAQERAYIRDYIDKIYSFYEIGIWTVLEKRSGHVIGRAGISFREGFEEPELGFVIGKKWQKKGFAYEICCAIIKYGREELDFSRFQAFVEPANTESVHLCEKLGFQREGGLMDGGREYFRMVLDAAKPGRF